MFGEITAWLLEAIKTHGMIAVVLGVIIETVIVPLPSPLIIMTAGFILIPHGTIVQIILAALWISVIAGIAQTFGSYLLYGIGYFGGKPIIQRYEKLHGVSWKEIQQFEKKFKGKNESFMIFLLRALPIMPLSVISGLAGIMKIDFKRYTIMTFFGTVPRNIVLALCGFFFSGFYEIIAKRIDNAETIMTVFAVLLICLYILGKKTGMIDKIRKTILK
ncbi:MAG: VTT domain-containing protein [Candidatus Woesearchaeota archaeon]|nr:VTT domain-containing protein [Candidatus Woesearchaeota archaeon]